MQPPGGDPVPLPMPRSVTSHRRLKISQGENIDTTETGECYQPRVLLYFIFQESLFNIYQPTPRIRSLIRSRSHLLIRPRALIKHPPCADTVPGGGSQRMKGVGVCFLKKCITRKGR